MTPRKTWTRELHTLILPIVVSAFIAAIVWVTQAALAAKYENLTPADEHRIVTSVEDYVDKQTKILRDDISEVRKDVRLILAEMQKRESKPTK